MGFHHSHPGSFTWTEYSSYTQVAIVRPIPSDDDEYDGCGSKEKMNDMKEPAPGIESGSSD